MADGFAFPSRPSAGLCPDCRQPSPWGCRCDACRAKRDAEERERAESLDRKIVLEGIPARYRWASFEAPELAQRVKNRSAVAAAQKALDLPAVALVGPAGAGKTSLAVAMLRAVVAKSHASGRQYGRQCPRFIATFALVSARLQMPLGQGEAEIVLAAMRAPLLVLDDLGAEQAGGGNRVVAEVLHARHENARPTIITTGLGQGEVAAAYGDGIARRVFEEGVIPCGR